MPRLTPILLLLLTCALLPGPVRGAEEPLRLQLGGGRLAISGQVSARLDAVEVRLHSERNLRPTRISTISPRAPEKYREPSPHLGEREVHYPVVDVALQAGLEGVARLSAAPTRAYLNQHLHKEPLTVGRELLLRGDQLAHWENALFVEPGTVALEEFHLRARVPVVHGGFARTFELLSPRWAGRVTVHDPAGALLLEGAVVAPSMTQPAAAPGDALEPARLRAAVVASLEYLLRSQETNPASPFHGGLNLFYDLEAATFRSNYWIWGWGPAVRLLLEAQRRPALATAFPAGRLRSAAEEIGQASLRFLVRDPAHPARGVPVSRWNRNLSFATGFEERISVADAQFLAGWAWLPLHRETRDPAFLAAARTLTDATDRLTREFGVPPQDYYHELHKWSDHIVDESGFGMEGLAELYLETRDPRHLEIGRAYFEAVRTRLERPDGVWNRGWSKTKGIQPAGYIARGMGWAMEGLLAAHRVLPGDGYLQRAERLAEHLMRWQKPDGSWTFHADKPVSEVGIAEKATALWSLLFYNLHRETRDPRHLAAAQKALRWCVENQYAGPDPDARGGIPGIGPASAVGYRAWYPVSCTYTSAFFGLAAVAELERAR